ncbi:MAG TPA: DinB family protein [Acidimicrobiales bacterium]|nr:DinB family protein [Acidimicrobiales bacterium]
MSLDVVDSLSRRMRAMHSLWEDAVATMDVDQVNHVEREPVLPIAFSLFHFVQIEDGSVTMLGGPPMIYDDSWATRIGLTIHDNGKHKTVDEMVHQRIADYGAFREYMDAVFAKTEGYVRTLDAESLAQVVVAPPYPPNIASTYSARVGGDTGITRWIALECWVYQHGLRHMGEIEHARALVGLQGMTS